MSVELDADGGTDLLFSGTGDDGARERPHLAGDLPSVLEAGPMFRRAVLGYDRFQVDTYVQWAEGELATADREHEHLLSRHLRTQAALDETRALLPHSSAAGEFLQVSRRIGSLLAAAGDEAESLRADAEADRAAASAHAQQTAAHAQRLLDDAAAEAGRVTVAAATDAALVLADARATAEAARREAEQVRGAALSEADARLRGVQALELRAAEQAEQVRSRPRPTRPRPSCTPGTRSSGCWPRVASCACVPTPRPPPPGSGCIRTPSTAPHPCARRSRPSSGGGRRCGPRSDGWPMLRPSEPAGSSVPA